MKDRPWSAEENRRVVMEAVEIFGTGRCMGAANFPVAGLRVGYREQVTAMLAMFDGFTAGERHVTVRVASDHVAAVHSPKELL